MFLSLSLFHSIPLNVTSYLLLYVSLLFFVSLFISLNAPLKSLVFLSSFLMFPHESLMFLPQVPNFFLHSWIFLTKSWNPSFFNFLIDLMILEKLLQIQPSWILIYQVPPYSLVLYCSWTVKHSLDWDKLTSANLVSKRILLFLLVFTLTWTTFSTEINTGVSKD